jgi:hypothetical protein
VVRAGFDVGKVKVKGHINYCYHMLFGISSIPVIDIVFLTYMGLSQTNYPCTLLNKFHRVSIAMMEFFAAISDRLFFPCQPPIALCNVSKHNNIKEFFFCLFSCFFVFLVGLGF